MIWSEHPKIEIFNADCMPALEKMDENQFDLAIVDPPYGIGEFLRESNSGSYKKPSKAVKHNYVEYKVNWNSNIPANEYFDSLKLKSDKRIIWGANYYNCFENGGAVIWYKNPGFISQLSQCEIASVSWRKMVDYIELRKPNGFLKKDIEYIHPCEKPVALYKWLLKNYAKEGYKILDTHLGSGSIAIACYDMGFSLTGFEIDKDYYDAAYKRFKQHIAQLKLF